MGTGAAGVNRTFGDLVAAHVSRSFEQCATTYPLVVETLDLLTEDKILKQGRTTLARAKAILILDGAADITRHEDIGIIQVELR